MKHYVILLLMILLFIPYLVGNAIRSYWSGNNKYLRLMWLEWKPLLSQRLYKTFKIRLY